MRTNFGVAGGTPRLILADHPFSESRSELSTISTSISNGREWPNAAVGLAGSGDADLCQPVLFRVKVYCLVFNSIVRSQKRNRRATDFLRLIKVSYFLNQIDKNFRHSLVCSYSPPQKPPNLPLKHSHQRRIHKPIPIRNIETNNFLAFNLRCEGFTQLRLMLPFHHKNHIRPFDVSNVQHRIGVMRQTGRISFHAGPRRKNLLGRRTSKSITTTDKKRAHQANKPLTPPPSPYLQ